MECLLIVAPTDLKLGWIITLVGIFVVFSSLVVLSILFNQIPKLLKIRIRNWFRKTRPTQKEPQPVTPLNSETNAAIALAIYLYFSESHDREPNVITIEKVSKRYSPWSSKIYGLRNINFR